MKKHILVTGGAGYIGSHTCKHLAQKGFTPVTLDNLSTGYEHFVKWGPLVKGSINDSTLVKQTLHHFKPLAVIHFAAHINVGESVTNPGKYYENNVVQTLSFLNTLKEVNLSNIVFSSTAAAYGTPQFTPIPESHTTLPINPYGHGKLFIETVLNDYFNAYGLKSVIFRYFNAAGADFSGEVGENHIPETHLIPLICDALLGHIPELKIFGDDYPTPDGTCIRDYVHVNDLANAHVLAVEYLLAEGNPLLCNLGSGQGFSILDIINQIEKITGKKVPKSMSPRREGDPASLVADASKALQTLGWKTQYSDIDTILQTAWDWHPKRFV